MYNTRMRNTAFILLNTFNSPTDRLVLMLGGTKNGHAYTLIQSRVNKYYIDPSQNVGDEHIDPKQSKQILH